MLVNLKLSSLCLTAFNTLYLSFNPLYPLLFSPSTMSLPALLVYSAESTGRSGGNCKLRVGYNKLTVATSAPTPPSAPPPSFYLPCATIKLLREIYFCQFGEPQKKAQFKTRRQLVTGQAASSSTPTTVSPSLSASLSSGSYLPPSRTHTPFTRLSSKTKAISNLLICLNYGVFQSACLFVVPPLGSPRLVAR